VSMFFYILILLAACMVSAIAQVFLKKASQKEYGSLIRQYLNIWVVSGYAMFFAVMVLNIWLLKFIPMTVVSPVSESLPLLLSFLTGKIFFGEAITRRKVLGAACIVAGIIIVIL